MHFLKLLIASLLAQTMLSILFPHLFSMKGFEIVLLKLFLINMLKKFKYAKTFVNFVFMLFMLFMLPLLVPSLQPSLPLLALEYPSELSVPVLAQELAVVYPVKY